jgi:hypothetical protein
VTFQKELLGRSTPKFSRLLHEEKVRRTAGKDGRIKRIRTAGLLRRDNSVHLPESPFTTAIAKLA